MVYLAPLWRHPGILMEAGPRRYGHQWYNNTWYSFLHWQKYNFEHYGALQGQFVLYLVSQGDKMVQLQSRKYVEVSWLLPPDTISPSWALPHTCVLQPYHSTFMKAFLNLSHFLHGMPNVRLCCAVFEIGWEIRGKYPRLIYVGAFFCRNFKAPFHPGLLLNIANSPKLAKCGRSYFWGMASIYTAWPHRKIEN